MKNFRFLLLALAVSAITFAFTAAPEKSTSTTTYYAFTSAGVLLGSASTEAALKAEHCPGPDTKFCAEVWTGINNGAPAGVQRPDLFKP